MLITKLRISWDNYFKYNFFIGNSYEERSDIFHHYNDIEFKIQPSHLGTGEKFIKIGFLGDMMSGRSVLIHRYIKNEFIIKNSTVAYENNFKEINNLNEKINLELWDFSGQNRFIELIKSFLCSLLLIFQI